MNDEKILEKIYYNPGHPAAYSNANRLYLAVNKRISKKNIVNWLKKQLTYTLHRYKRITFPRLNYIVDIDDQWQTDLIDLKSISSTNKGYNFIVVVIDVFSKFAWTVPIKQKSADEIINVFDRIFKISSRKPLYLVSDKGKEFTNEKFQNFLKRHSIKFFTAKNDDTKACIAERFIRSIKELIFKHLTSNNTLKYVDSLENLTKTYNRRYHRTIGMAPSDVNERNIREVWFNTKASQNNRIRKEQPKFRVGTYVRVSKPNNIYAKGYLPNYSDEIYKIFKVIRGKRNTYKLHDLMNEEIDGSYYEEEIQEVVYNEESIFRIKSILATRNNNGRKESLVEWKGWPAKFNSWIPSRSIK